MKFVRIETFSPDDQAVARGWIADRHGVEFDAGRGYGGQSRTARRLLDQPSMRNVEHIAWVTSLQSKRRGSGAAALRKILDRFDEAGAEVTGLIVLPDDDAFVPRLVWYYRRFGFGFEPADPHESYAATDFPIMLRWRA